MAGLERRDLAPPDGVPRGAQRPEKILRRRQRRDIDAEKLGRIDDGRRRQQLPGQRPQQIGLAVDQKRQRRRRERPRDEIGQAPPRVGNAARPAARIARTALDEPPARIARARRKTIRTK
jgi:hypothetical protein